MVGVTDMVVADMAVTDTIVVAAAVEITEKDQVTVRVLLPYSPIFSDFHPTEFLVSIDSRWHLHSWHLASSTMPCLIKTDTISSLILLLDYVACLHPCL